MWHRHWAAASTCSSTAAAAQVGIESTVVDLTGPVPRLLRPGMISRRALEAVIGPLALDETEPSGDAPRRSPGQVERHYAPRAELQLLTRAQLEALAADGGRPGRAPGSDRASATSGCQPACMSFGSRRLPTATRASSMPPCTGSMMPAASASW